MNHEDLAMNGLKQNILDLQKYLLPSNKLWLALSNVLQSYEEFKKDKAIIQITLLENELDMQSEEITSLKYENSVQKQELAASQQKIASLESKFNQLEQFLISLGFKSTDQSDDHLPNTLVSNNDSELSGQDNTMMDCFN